MQPGQRRGATRAWEQLELLGPRPRLPQWSALPQGVRHEVARLLAHILREANGDAAEGGHGEEVGDE